LTRLATSAVAAAKSFFRSYHAGFQAAEGPDDVLVVGADADEEFLVAVGHAMVEP
jgi:hypothetical protein